MNRISRRPVFAALLAALCILSLAACGGHDRSSSSDNSSSASSQTASASSSVAPSEDISGTWNTELEDVALGTTTFHVSSDGAITGHLKTDTGETGAINGTLSGSDAEYTVSFKAKTYLCSLVFSSSTTASGSLVDAAGHMHDLKLTR